MITLETITDIQDFLNQDFEPFETYQIRDTSDLEKEVLCSEVSIDSEKTLKLPRMKDYIKLKYRVLIDSNLFISMKQMETLPKLWDVPNRILKTVKSLRLKEINPLQETFSLQTESQNKLSSANSIWERRINNFNNLLQLSSLRNISIIELSLFQSKFQNADEVVFEKLPFFK
jgi:hypothetical protein